MVELAYVIMLQTGLEIAAFPPSDYADVAAIRIMLLSIELG